MLGRIIGLALAVALWGAAYVILNPGGLDGRIPAVGLGAFESVRLGLGIAAGLLGAALAAAALMRAPERPPARDRLAPLIDAHEGEADDLDPSDEPLPFSSASATAPLQAPTLEAEPAPFPLELDTGVQPTPPVVVQAELAPEPEPEVAAMPAEPEPEAAAESPPPEDFDAARDALRRHARDEAWGPASLALQRVEALAQDDRQHALAAQDAGDFSRAQGKTDDAIEAYDLALAHARMTGQQDLIADALINAGDMAYEEHRLDAAVENYEAAVALRRDLAQAVGTAEARRALSIALERLADAREDRGHRSRALDLYRESEALAAELAEADAARYGGDLAATRQRLEELEARILA
jgi:tetratricopeptide (TPR) repeat protein